MRNAIVIYSPALYVWFRLRENCSTVSYQTAKGNRLPGVCVSIGLLLLWNILMTHPWPVWLTNQLLITWHLSSRCLISHLCPSAKHTYPFGPPPLIPPDTNANTDPMCQQKYGVQTTSQNGHEYLWLLPPARLRLGSSDWFPINAAWGGNTGEHR